MAFQPRGPETPTDERRIRRRREMADVLSVNEQNFQSEILEHKGVAVVDFSAEWCGPCRFITPIIENLQKQYADAADVKFAKLDVDEARKIALEYGIRAVPTLIVFKDGNEVERMLGVQPEAVIRDRVEKHRG